MDEKFDPFKSNQKTTRKRRSAFLLGLDAWIDTSLYESKFAAGETWEEIVIFFRRFRVYGINRAIAELLGEAATLGTAGAVLLLAFALPAAEEVSSNWRDQEEFAVTFLDRYGNEIGQRGILHADAAPIEELPDHLVKAVLATEDRRFYEHYGIDIVGLTRAMSENVRANDVVQGGSTITQQLAKNLFLSNERTITRKIKEAYLALWLEAHLSKDEILKLYLDRAYMGGGTFGVAAAARFYFDKDIRQISLAESAMLAGLFKAPARYAPHINLPAARGRANEVLTNIVQAEFMTEGQVTGARRNPADVVLRDSVDSPDYFLDWAFLQVKDFILQNRIPTRSVVVRSTVDLSMQRAAEESVEFHLRQYGDSYRVTQSAAVVIENTGAVRAMVGGRDYGESQFNRATSGSRQPGSSFKPYVYAAAVETGMTAETVVRDQPVSWRGWSPQNYNRRYAGRVSLATALARSINTVPVRLARDTIGGTKPIVELAHKMGVESDLITHHTMVLGTGGMTVMDQATGYLALATGGIGNKRHAFTQIFSSTGELLYDVRVDERPEGRVLSLASAESMNRMLVNVTEWGTGRRAQLEPVKVAGKTGTTQSYRDAWFVGYTGNFTTAVWYGNDDYTPTNNLTGGRLPAQTFQQIMAFAHQGVDLKAMPGVEGSIKIPVNTEEDGSTEESDPSGLLVQRAVPLSDAMSDYLRGLSGRFAAQAPLVRDPGTVASTR
ncbi:MAG: PBP1A family penicillin-binding protein [Pseudomonadota bacterium]